MSPGGDHDGGTHSKRVAEEPQQRPTRSKRSRYVNKACNECKRRKLKCDGEEPCERCLSQKSECVYTGPPSHYAPAWNFGRSDIQYLSTEIQNMRSNMNQVMKKLMLSNNSDVPPPESLAHLGQELEVQHSAVIHDSPVREETSHTSSREPSPHRGPTSSGYAFEVARERLEAIGLNSLEAEPLSRRDELSFFSNSLFDIHNYKSILEKDPLSKMDQQEVCRLIDVWSNGIGSLFPIVDNKQLHARWESLHRTLTCAKTHMSKQKFLNAIESLFDGETHILKLILANALTAESGGINEIAKRLFESTGGIPQATFMKIPTLRNINMLVLVSLLYYHLDDEMRANRVISLASRLCFEMGLHRTETFQRNIKDEKDKMAAGVTFWVVYILERRSSIGLGVPFIMQDLEIDPSLPRPSIYPYLEAMVGLTKLSGEVCRRTSTLRDRSVKFPVEEVDYQDYKVLQWQKQLSPDLTSDFSEIQQNQQCQLRMSTVPKMYLALVLHIRTQQLRGLIYRPVLYSTARITENKSHAQTAVDIARESVRFLAIVSRSTSLATDEPLFFRDFLMSHLAAILLAVSNGLADLSRQLCDEYYLAIDVFRDLRSRSPVIARIWNSVSILNVIGPKLGLSRVPQVMQVQSIDNASENYTYSSASQDVTEAIVSEHGPLGPVNLTLPTIQRNANTGTVDSGDFMFSTSMLPLQFRNELSMMNESLDDMSMNLLDCEFSDDFNLNASWQA